MILVYKKKVSLLLGMYSFVVGLILSIPEILGSMPNTINKIQDGKERPKCVCTPCVLPALEGISPSITLGPYQQGVQHRIETLTLIEMEL